MSKRTPQYEVQGTPLKDAEVPDKQEQEKPQETKAQRFRRLADRRLPKAVKMIGYLVPLANKAQYESSVAQKAYIIAQLRKAVDAVENALKGVHETVAEIKIPD